MVIRATTELVILESLPLTPKQSVTDLKAEEIGS